MPRVSNDQISEGRREPRLGLRVRLRGRLEVRTILSPSLENNRLGDPHERELVVYLPPSYDRSDQHYPVVCMLPGYASSSLSSIGYRLWDESTFELFERLVASGTPEAILFTPDCMTRLGGSQYLDSTGTGAYATHVEESLAFVESNYRALGTRDARAIVGRSSGGFGALRMALDRPHLFGAVGSHAGDALFPVSLRPDMTQVAITLDRAGGVAAFLERIERSGPRGGGDFTTLAMLAYAGAYAPAPDAAWPHIELPVDPATGQLTSAWDRFLEHDPITRLARDPRALGDLALVYVDAGDRDEHGLQFAARELARMLDGRGSPLFHEEFEGTHRGTHARYAESLPRLLGALRRA
jgi:Putative esterase